MKYSDIKDLSVAELRKKRSALVEELFEVSMKNKVGQLTNPVQIRYMRRNIARLNTALAQSNGR